MDSTARGDVKKLVIFGAGVGADLAFRCFNQDSDYEVCAFTVDRAHLHASEYLGLPVVAFDEVEQDYSPETHEIFVFIDYIEMNAIREQKFEEAKSKGYKCASYVASSNEFLFPPAIGENCFVLWGQQIDLNVQIGNNTVLWAGNHIGDRSVIGDHVWITSHVCLSGDVTVDNGCFLGVNCTVGNKVRLGPRTFVGAGALIVKDTAENSVYVEPATQKSPLDSMRFSKLIGH